MLAAAGWLAERLAFANGRVEPTAGHPVVRGEWLGAPGAPTVLVYGHYDVQPTGDAERVDRAAVRAGRRGRRGPRPRGHRRQGPGLHRAADRARVHRPGGRPAAERQVPARGRGGDRQPAPGRLRHRAGRRAGRRPGHLGRRRDVAAGRAVAVGGVQGPGLPRHRGHRGPVATCTRAATAAPSPTRCTRSPRSSPACTTATGGSRSAGFYDGIPPLSAGRRAEIAAVPFDEQAYLRDLGLREPHGEPGYSTLERLWERPTLEVNGVRGGGKYTVIPHEAVAHVSCRLVPGQDPDAVLARVAEHVGAQPAAGRARCARTSTRPGSRPTRSPPGHPAIRAASAALAAVYPGQEVLLALHRRHAAGRRPVRDGARRQDAVLLVLHLRREPARAERVPADRPAARGHAGVGSAVAATGRGRDHVMSTADHAEERVPRLTPTCRPGRCPSSS